MLLDTSQAAAGSPRSSFFIETPRLSSFLACDAMNKQAFTNTLLF
jgi:hypothetical protein